MGKNLDKIKAIQLTSESYKLSKVKLVFEDVCLAAESISKDLVIDDSAGIERTSLILKDIKLIIKEIESKRKSITDPLNKRVKEINSFIKEYKDRLPRLSVFAQIQHRARKDSSFESYGKLRKTPA